MTTDTGQRIKDAIDARADQLTKTLDLETTDREWTALSAPARHADRRSWMAPLAAAILVIAIGLAGTWLLSRGDTKHHAVSPNPIVAAHCPTRFGAAPTGFDPLWVPAKPTGVKTHGRLVPDLTPMSIVVCAYYEYSTGNQHGGVLHAHTMVTKYLDNARAYLLAKNTSRTGGAQPTCSIGLGGPIADLHQNSYLIGLKYGSGTVWISTRAGDCPNASNGDATTNFDIWNAANTAFAYRYWPLSPGRHLGGATTMVPATPKSLTIWKAPGPGDFPKGTEKTVTKFADLVAALNAAPHLTSRRCHTSDNVLYALTFTYRDGPPVVITVVHGCGIDGGPHIAETPAIDQLIEHLRGS